jgi:putative ABC transport system substrate-binding protein
VATTGILWATSPSLATIPRDAFRNGMIELGYVEGQNFLIVDRYAEGKLDRLRGLAAELVRLRVAVIVTPDTPPVHAAKTATSTIPIVMTTTGDPVGSCLVTTLARPGGNITGLTNAAAELGSKRLELLKEALPKLSRVAALWGATNSSSPGDPYGRTVIEEAARSPGLKLRTVAVHSPEDFPRAFDDAVQARAEALVVLPSPILARHSKLLAELAARHRLPTMYQDKEFADAGGLVAYGPSNAAQWHRAAYYVDKTGAAAPAGRGPSRGSGRSWPDSRPAVAGGTQGAARGHAAPGRAAASARRRRAACRTADRSPPTPAPGGE